MNQGRPKIGTHEIQTTEVLVTGRFPKFFVKNLQGGIWIIHRYFKVYARIVQYAGAVRKCLNPNEESWYFQVAIQ